MGDNEFEIKIKKDNLTEFVTAVKVSDSIYRLTSNSIYNNSLISGTVVATSFDENNDLNFEKRLQKSEFNIRRFQLSSKYNQSDYMMLGEEITKHGGHWEVVIGSLAFINLPKNSSFNLDEILRIFEFEGNEIKEE